MLNNTFDGNEYAITGGDNLIALNNIFFNSSVLALKNVDGNSVVGLRFSGTTLSTSKPRTS